MRMLEASSWLPVKRLHECRESVAEKLLQRIPAGSWEKHNSMSSPKRKRQHLRLKAKEEAGPSITWKKLGLDLDTLACPICMQPFSPPVFQCKNGHAACSNCSQKMNTRGCPSCKLPIGRIRCLPIEKVIESLWVECELGCGTTLRFCDREEHKRSLCEYRPIECATHGCTHIGPMCAISKHLLEKHHIPTAEWCESTRTARFGLGTSKDMAMLVKAKDAWFVVSLVAHRKGHRMTCESVWTSGKRMVYLVLLVSLQPQMHLGTKVGYFGMDTCALSPGLTEEYEIIPRGNNSFDVGVSLYYLPD